MNSSDMRRHQACFLVAVISACSSGWGLYVLAERVTERVLEKTGGDRRHLLSGAAFPGGEGVCFGWVV